MGFYNSATLDVKRNWKAVAILCSQQGEKFFTAHRVKLVVNSTTIGGR
jgi:hypothetical protein